MNAPLKTVGVKFPVETLAQIQEVRRRAPGKIPTVSDVIRDAVEAFLDYHEAKIKTSKTRLGA